MPTSHKAPLESSPSLLAARSPHVYIHHHHQATPPLFPFPIVIKTPPDRSRSGDSLCHPTSTWQSNRLLVDTTMPCWMPLFVTLAREPARSREGARSIAESQQHRLHPPVTSQNSPPKSPSLCPHHNTDPQNLLQIDRVHTFGSTMRRGSGSSPEQSSQHRRNRLCFLPWPRDAGIQTVSEATRQADTGVG